MNAGIYENATSLEINLAVDAAHKCFIEFKNMPSIQKSAFLRSIAKRVEENRSLIIQTTDRETNLGKARLEGEFNRTLEQILAFARLAENESWKERIKEKSNVPGCTHAESQIIKENIPIGPVVIIGACNIPLAISVVGTDTASALAVGCPVIVKSHPRHPETCQLLSDAVEKAKKDMQMPSGCFTLLHGENQEVTAQLVNHEKTACVAFTGSLNGGSALSQVANKRESPIPFYAEMGSLNPNFVSPQAMRERSDELLCSYIDAVNLFAGQMCTKPGALVMLKESFRQINLESFRDYIRQQQSLPMLNRDVYENYKQNCLNISKELETIAHSKQSCSKTKWLGQVNVFLIESDEFLRRPELRTEAFGPSSMIVIADTLEEMKEIAKSCEGSLTGSIHVGDDDYSFIQKIFSILEARVGRIVWNGFPPGVNPGPATHHGGPWPATTDSRFTSIGLQGYRRFVRPICRQGFPDLTGMP